MGLRLVLVLLLVLLAACSQPQDEVLRFGLASAPANLDPRFATDATSTRINRLLYRRLVDFDEHARPKPALAHWQQLTPLHYRFTLQQDGRRFHDGSPLTAADVVASYRAVLDPATASPHRGTLTLIESVSAVDDDTVDFYLNRSDPLFPGYLAIGIMPAHALVSNHPLHQLPVGSGAFRLLDWPDSGRLQLIRTTDQQVIEFVHVKDPTVRVLKLMRGELDFIQNDLPTELISYLAAQTAFRVQRRAGSNFSYIGFNLADPVTGDVRIRRAVAHAINRAAVMQYVLGNGAHSATALLPPSHWAGHSTLTEIPYDPDAARALLIAAGYTANNPLVLTYKTSADPLRLRIATVFQQQMAEVGIKVNLQSYDWGTFYGDIKAGRFQMYSLAWVGIKTPDIFRYAFHSESLPPEGANRGRLRDKRVDDLIEQAEASSTLDQQAGLYRDLQAHLQVVLPYVPLWYEDHVYITRGTSTGYQLAADGNYDGLLAVKRVRD